MDLNRPKRAKMLAMEAIVPSFTRSENRSEKELSDMRRGRRQCSAPKPLYIIEAVRFPQNDPSMDKLSALMLRKVAEAEFPTQYGCFRIFGFEGASSNGVRQEEAVVLR